MKAASNPVEAALRTVEANKPKPEHTYRWGSIEAHGFTGGILEAIDYAARLLLVVVPWVIGAIFIVSWVLTGAGLR